MRHASRVTCHVFCHVSRFLSRVTFFVTCHVFCHVSRFLSRVTKCFGFAIDGRKICFSIFFQWLQSIKSVHYSAAKLKKNYKWHIILSESFFLYQPPFHHRSDCKDIFPASFHSPTAWFHPFEDPGREWSSKRRLRW